MMCRSWARSTSSCTAALTSASRLRRRDCSAPTLSSADIATCRRAEHAHHCCRVHSAASSGCLSHQRARRSAGCRSGRPQCCSETETEVLSRRSTPNSDTLCASADLLRVADLCSLSALLVTILFLSLMADKRQPVEDSQLELPVQRSEQQQSTQPTGGSAVAVERHYPNARAIMSVAARPTLLVA